MVNLQRLQLISARLLAAQTPDEAFRLLSQLRFPWKATDVEDMTSSESQWVVEHAYRSVGRHEGTASVVSMLLAQRFGPLTEETKVRIEALSIFQLRDVAERLLKAQTLNEALDVERWPASAARVAQEVLGPE